MAQRTPALDSTLTGHIEDAMRGLEDVPGLAVAVVRDTGIVYARGFGRRNRRTGDPMTPETVFYIASHSKALTGMTAALLADEGLLDLDAPISRYLPSLSFQSADLSSDSISVRDLLTHTSGIANPAITWRTSYTGQYTADDLVQILGEYSTARPRTFQYTNLGYVVAGLILQRVVGADWRHVVARRVLGPVGMKRTTGFVTEVEREGWPLAQPYSAVGNPPHNTGTMELEPIPFWKTNQTIQGAGGHLSTAEDLARWVRLHLNDGRLDGTQVLPTSVVRSVRQRGATVDQTFYRFDRRGYGLGWYIADYGAETLIHHFGSFAGYRSHVSFMPEHDLGVVALVNETSAGFFLPDFVATCAYALARGNEEADSVCRSGRKDLVRRTKSALEQQKGQFAERADEFPRPLDAYTGRYRHPALGTLAIGRRDGQLHAVLGLVETALDPLDGDVLRIEAGGAGTTLDFEFPEGVERATAVELVGYRMKRVGR